MLTETHEHEEIIERVAALDIGKAELMCCTRVPDPGRPGRRQRGFADATFTIVTAKVTGAPRAAKTAFT